MDNGYKYAGYARNADNSYYINVVKSDADALIIDTAKKLEGKTIKDLYKKDMYVGCFGDIEKDCTFSTTIGDVAFSFKIDGSFDIVKKYRKEDESVEVEEMKELRNMPISNVKFTEIMYTVSFDESFDVSKFETGDDFVLDISEEKLKDYVIKEIYYDNIPENFLN